MFDTIHQWLLGQFAYFKDNALVMEIFFLVLITAILAASESIAYRFIYPKLKKSWTVWDDSLLHSLHKPLHFFIWIIGLCFAGKIASTAENAAAIFDYVPMIRSVGIILVITWFLLRFIQAAEENFIDGKTKSDKLDKTTVYALGKIFRIAVIITAALVLLQTFDIRITGILAVGGLGGAALAFASKDLLANYFGGLIIYLDRPFAVGDWIRSPDRNIEGTVEHIGWRLCRIRTFDKRPLYIPNTVFTTISIENPSRMSNRRIKTNVGLRYDDAEKMAVILKDVETMLKNHEEIDTNQTLMVNLVEFAPSSLSFMIYCFTKTTKWEAFQAIQQDVFLKVIDIIVSHGASCAFPTTTMHIPDGIAVQHEPAVATE